MTNTLVAPGVSENIASQDARKIEHNLSDETFGALKKNYYAVTDNK